MFSKGQASHPALWAHYHIPKTGGQTIRHELVAQLEIGETMVHLGPWAADQGIVPSSTEELAAQTPSARDRIRAIVGHTVNTRTISLFEGRTIKKITVLRDPADRIVSHYNFKVEMLQRRGKPTLSFEEWYDDLGPNAMTRFIAPRIGMPSDDVAAIVTELSTFEFVGWTEQMDDWLPDLLAAMGLKRTLPSRRNVTGRHHQRVLQLDDNLRSRLLSDNPMDVELYESTAVLCKHSFERIRKSNKFGLPIARQDP